VKILEAEASFDLLSYNGLTMETIEECTKYQPDVIIMGCVLPHDGIIKVVSHIHQVLPATHIVIVTEHQVINELSSAVQAGLRGYLTSSVSGENLIAAIKLALEDKLVISPQMSKNLIRTLQLRPLSVHVVGEKINSLTQQENKVLKLVKQGLTNKEIGTKLNVTENTIKVHLRNIMEKLQAHTRQEAVTFMDENDLLGKGDLY